jgi:hypothetical protein
MRKFRSQEQSLRGSPQWRSFKQQQQEVAYSGIGAQADTGFMKYSLGISGLNASPNSLYFALFGNFSGTGGALGSSKSGYTNEWTSTGSSVDTAYVRTLAGTGNSGVGATEWTVAAYVNGTGVVATNATQVTFAAVTGSPVYLASVGLVDSSSYGTGNVWWMADLATPFQVAVGIQIAFYISDVSLTLA